MKRLSKIEFISTLERKFPMEKFEIREYIGTSKKGKYYCGLCKTEYSLSRMGILLQDDREHVCSHCWASSYTQDILNYFKTEENLIFEQLGYSKTLHKPTVIYKCMNCNSLTEKPFAEFFKYPTCIHCGNNAKRLNNTGIELRLPKEFSLLEIYQGKEKPILIKHECGFVFKGRVHDLVRGHSYCPKCSKKASKGERSILSFLETNNLSFAKEKTFIWSGLYRYDFCLEEYKILIEYHGIQHYQEVEFFGSFEKRQNDDKTKELLAKNNNYSLIIISYKDFDNISNILAQRLSQLGVVLSQNEMEST